jgi:hypothetical protein
MEDLIEKWERILHIFDISENSVEEKHEEVIVERLCWHCCHSIPYKVLYYPFAYDDRARKFKVGGQFCSWECIKGYARDTMSKVVSGVHQLNIRNYRKQMTGLMDHVVPAPPKMTLKSFGGHLGIDDFRKPIRHIDYVVNYAKLAKVIPYQTLEYKFEEKHSKVVDKPLHIQQNDVKNDSLKLRRPKPLTKGKSTLERALGLNQFANFIKTS